MQQISMVVVLVAMLVTSHAIAEAESKQRAHISRRDRIGAAEGEAGARAVGEWYWEATLAGRHVEASHAWHTGEVLRSIIAEDDAALNEDDRQYLQLLWKIRSVALRKSVLAQRLFQNMTIQGGDIESDEALPGQLFYVVSPIRANGVAGDIRLTLQWIDDRWWVVDVDDGAKLTAVQQHRELYRKAKADGHSPAEWLERVAGGARLTLGFREE